MQLVAGVLERVLDEGRLAIDAARGMTFLHAADVVHRDLKSANLLVTSGFSVKVADFGLARVKARATTMTGQMGTMQWMAPEVLSNCRYTEKADVYSFGVILWELVTRACPYEAETEGQIQAAMAVLKDGLRPRVPSTAEMQPVRFPTPYVQLMEQCWAQDAAARPPFAEVLGSLEGMPSH